MRWDGAALARLPAFAALHPLFADLGTASPPSLAVLSSLAAARGVRSGRGVPIRFVPPMATELGYEARIYASGEVPTREHTLHDCFNALAWLAFPRSKAAINRLHVELPPPSSGGRGTARDVLTLFDEDGLVMLCADASLEALLREFRWRELFVARRGDVVRNARFLAFGHGLLEKLAAPFHGLTAKTIVVGVAPERLDAPLGELVAIADEAVAAAVESSDVLGSTRALAPLPVLGIPGWFAANEDPAYYDDATQFRPGRTRARIEAPRGAR